MVSIEAFLFGLATALIGYLVGNWLTIGRDRRKEFNDLIGPIRNDLLGVRNHPDSNLKGSWMIAFTMIRERLPFWKRKGFDRAVENYKKSKGADNQGRDEMGGWFYKDTAIIVHAVNDLLRFLKPR